MIVSVLHVGDTHRGLGISKFSSRLALVSFFKMLMVEKNY